ncbi:uncharacterized protein LOC126904919 [Daktulosphaira vitifoliae]|uniref:uncharacterized protein LOC126904919 n=1 Tax=Daktulosphaira vitifoliae TaxID=58002 RepID=UPI0021AAE61F|nr:uncharacterized protein LOC126904919 [Daktulosphaira vitifoliae]
MGLDFRVIYAVQHYQIKTHSCVQKVHHLTKYGIDYNIAIGNHPDSRTLQSCGNEGVPSCTGGMKRNYNNDVTVSSVRIKQRRLDKISSSTFQLIGSSLNKIFWFYKKNVEKIDGYKSFLFQIKNELINKLYECLENVGRIKFNLKLEATYNIPNQSDTNENRSFKTSAVELFASTDISTIVDNAFEKLIDEEKNYAGKGSNFSFLCIDGILLGVYKYSPLSANSFIELPKDIKNKCTVINPQNIDSFCFKWAILAKKMRGKNNANC